MCKNALYRFLLGLAFAVPQTAAIPVVDIYKLALQWPRVVCSSTHICDPTITIPTVFTIHGIWAQDAQDRSVLQYGPGNLSTNPSPIKIKKIIIIKNSNNFTDVWLSSYIYIYKQLLVKLNHHIYTD